MDMSQTPGATRRNILASAAAGAGAATLPALTEPALAATAPATATVVVDRQGLYEPSQMEFSDVGPMG